jgi:hypothetical protein
MFRNTILGPLIWIRIRNSLKSRIRIRNEKFRIHNTAIFTGLRMYNRRKKDSV